MSAALTHSMKMGDHPAVVGRATATLSRGGRRWMPRLFLPPLAGAMVALSPAAHASPPDQTWIAGLYDNADYDDAVLAVLASLASLARQPLHDPQYVNLVIAFVLTIDESLPTLPSLSSNRPRAPPAPSGPLTSRLAATDGHR